MTCMPFIFHFLELISIFIYLFFVFFFEEFFLLDDDFFEEEVFWVEEVFLEEDAELLFDEVVATGV